MGVALFDLDHTLLDVNSGTLWLKAEWREGRLGLRDVVWAGWWLGKYSVGIGTGLDGVFEVAAKALKGTSESELAARVQAWFDREVRHHLRVGAEEALQRHRAAGDRLVLATSGTQYVARAAAEAYGLDTVVCTELEVVDGTFTGNLAVLAVGAAKATACEAWAVREGVDLSEATFYTDSATDAALLRKVGQPRVVAPDRRLRRMAAEEGWPVVDWGVATPP
ncbi:MAG: HAD-IB family hydrolase [Myxococcales bacterium]|nr:HAD-IB family hydrolase [Myxococcales bacterium]